MIFSEKPVPMLVALWHGFGPDRPIKSPGSTPGLFWKERRWLAHIPQKWIPVLRSEYAQNQQSLTPPA
jgi:hypothetical protein